MQHSGREGPPGQEMADPAGGLKEDLQLGRLTSWWARQSVGKLLLFALLLAAICLSAVLWAPKRAHQTSMPGRRPFLCALTPLTLLAACMHACKQCCMHQASAALAGRSRFTMNIHGQPINSPAEIADAHATAPGRRAEAAIVVLARSEACAQKPALPACPTS